MANILLENASAWSKMKKGLVSDIRSSSKRKITETVLENARKAALLQEHASMGATQASNVAVINKVMMPLIKRVMPTVMAHELVGVQPLTGPSGLITTMRVRYATTSPMNGEGIIAGQEALSPYLTGAWYSGNENMNEPGAADTAVLEGVGGNEVNIELVKDIVAFSTNPGRFVCNNLYFHLLANYPNKSLFIHIPECNNDVDNYKKYAKQINEIISKMEG